MLSPYEVFVVKVDCELDEVEAREASRGDRMLGMARWQYPRVHRGVEYDLVVDTGKQTAAECAERIKRKFEL